MPVNSLTPEQEAAAEALFARLPRQAPVFMFHVCRFLDDPLDLKAFAPASARVLECPELRELSAALKQDITGCNDNFVLAFEAAWELSRIAAQRRDRLEEAHDVHAGQWATLRRRLLATLADTADHYGAGRLFNEAIGRRVRRASARVGALPILDWEKAEAVCGTFRPPPSVAR
jgi:hypothetical protein